MIGSDSKLFLSPSAGKTESCKALAPRENDDEKATAADLCLLSPAPILLKVKSVLIHALLEL